MIRVGSGYDIHALAPDRDLILGGVKIPHELGLAGHSDADVLLHAIIDSLLGALALGDIDSWFPDTDPKYKDADSKFLFAEVWREVQARGWKLENIDTLVIAEKPKLRPHVDNIRESIANLFSAELDQISLKATTSEKLGFVGREEGIAASATVLISRQ